MTPDSQAIDSEQFSAVCPKCGASASTTVADRRSSMQCPVCGGGIDLMTDEAKHARLAAAAKASIRTHRGGG